MTTAESLGVVAFNGARSRFLSLSPNRGILSGIRRHGASRAFWGVAGLSFICQCVYDLAIAALQGAVWVAGNLRDWGLRVRVEQRLIKSLGNGLAGTVSLLGVVSPSLCLFLQVKLRACFGE